MTWYARLLCHHPYAVLSSVVVVVTTCVVLSFTARPLPAFTDPSLGFEARGTIISNRLVAWNNLKEASRGSGPLLVNPGGDPRFVVTSPPKTGNKTAKPIHVHGACIDLKPDMTIVELKNCTDLDPRRTAAEANGTDNSSYEDSPMDIISNSLDEDFEDFRDEQIHLGHNHLAEDGFFCNDVVPEYSRVVIKSTEPKENLFTLSNLLAICRLDLKLRSVREILNICETSNHQCCASWTLPNYIALLSNKTSCLEITQLDIERVHRLIWRCSSYFDLQIGGGCRKRGCDRVPEACLAHNAVYTILHYLSDASFFQRKDENHSLIEVNDIGSPSSTYSPKKPDRKKQKLSRIDFITKYIQSPQDHLSITNIFLPIARSSQALPYFEKLMSMSLKEDNLTVVAMDLGLKETLFDKLLIHDSMFVGIGGGIVVILMWCYTGSLFITVITIMTVVCSLFIAYFFYTFIFEIEFFPYMNVLTSVIAIGLGADDTFVYCRVWNLSKQDKNAGTLVKLVENTLHHASISIIVTSITTATAFFASYTSHITAIKCFSIFAGTVVLANLVLMLTWVPACIVIAERWSAGSCCLCVPPSPLYASHIPPACTTVCASPLKLCYWFSEVGRIYFEKVFPCIIIKPRVFWVFLFGCLAVCSGLIVFYYPRLSLPDSQDFQLFHRDHFFEQYELKYKYVFWFERNLRRDIMNRLPVRIIWGIKPVDNGDYLNPAMKGNLVFDDQFDMSSQRSQEWLLHFCKDLRNQSFYMSTLGPLLPNCFIETFKTWMEKRCHDPSSGLNRYPCCEESKFPYSRYVFEKCIHDGIKELYDTPHQFFIPGVAGPKFHKTNGKVAAIVIEYDSTYLWTLSYDEMDKFYNEVESWVQCKLKEAPTGLKNGWFISYFEFYDVQHSLLVGTGIAVAVAMGICLVVLLVSTLNIIVSIFAMISISAIILTTLAVLVLLGWRLNILESVTVSVAIGLAIDLTLHYGVAYRLAPDSDRESSVTWATVRLGSPVFMAAITSIAAGIAMLPAHVLAYVHVGTFLIVLSASSYLYATLFYLPLLSLFGPEYGCGQFSYPDSSCMNSCGDSEHDHVDKTVYSQQFTSELTLSTSSACIQPTSSTPNPDTHELEPLTNSRVPTRHRNSIKQSSAQAQTDYSSHGSTYPHVQHNGIVGANGRSRNSKSSRSRSLTSSASSSKEKRNKSSQRKVSLPSPSVDSEPSPRHSVGPASSITTILYSEPDTDPSGAPFQQQSTEEIQINRCSDGKDSMALVV